MKLTVQTERLDSGQMRVCLRDERGTALSNQSVVTLSSNHDTADLIIHFTVGGDGVASIDFRSTNEMSHSAISVVAA